MNSENINFPFDIPEETPNEPSIDGLREFTKIYTKS